jgi:hypothetical protein
MDGLFHTKRMASQSSFVKIASIYYSVAIFVLPLSVIYTVIKIYFPPLWNLGVKYPGRKRFAGFFVAIFIMAFSVLVICSMKGQDLRYIELGSSLVQMMAFGWMLFAFCGFLFGFGLIVLWKVVSGR